MRAGALALLFAACGRAPGPSTGSDLVPEGRTVIVAESAAGYDSAAIEAVDHSTQVQNTGFGLDVDTAVRRVWDPGRRTWRLFTLGRRTGRVTERDRDTQVIREWQAALPDERASSVDPLDLAIDRTGRLWITRGGSSRLLVLEGATSTRLDLARFAADVSCTKPGLACGNPSMSAVTYWNGAVYVALRRLEDGFDARSDAVVVRVDESTLAAATFVVLDGLRNPSERFTARDPDSPLRTLELMGAPLSSPPEASGGLVKVDLESARWDRLIDGRAQHAFVVSHVLQTEVSGLAILADCDEARLNPTRVVRFTADGTVAPTAIRTAAYDLWRVARLGPGKLLIATRERERHGLLVADDEGHPLGTVPTLLPPYDFEVLE